MFEIKNIGTVGVQKDEREKVARLRNKYPDQVLFRIRINNQEAHDGTEPVTGCCNGDDYMIPREQDWVCPEGHLESLRLANFNDMTMDETVEKGLPVWYRVQSERARFHLVVYGRLDLDALDKELAKEAKAAEKAAQKALAEQAKADAVAMSEEVAQ